ncbi:nucleotidyltransferase family protein [Halorussus caseinilyticus]|uniref:NTP transferase domain-containing protein n=1 Tax=Halorussus caseinilyticus TaxID=3034025 RepID=A0ABD5WEI4_9EURY|nr:nucleotidyltransferase family protein [Halorussus sp. DT72]
MILGALLAAGTGSRFDGGNKLLADLDGRPVVAHAARTLAESSLDAAVAVVGHDREAVERALPDGFGIVANPDYEAGQSASVRRAVESARERDADAVLFALGDMPRVSVETVDSIVRAYRELRDDPDAPGIVAPRYDGYRGNPVLFDARYFDELASVEGDTGGRALLASEPVTWVSVPDPGIHRDVDTVGDLRALQSDSTSDRG